MTTAALLFACAACDGSAPTSRSAAPARVETRGGAATSAPTTVPSAAAPSELPPDRPLPSGPTAHGLLLPSGAELIASNELGDDYVVPFEVDAVVGHVRSELEESRFEPNGTGGGSFRRVTPRGAPASTKLYVLVVPYPGRGTMIRVQPLPAEELTPEALERNVQRFQEAQRRLD